MPVMTKGGADGDTAGAQVRQARVAEGDGQAKHAP